MADDLASKSADDTWREGLSSPESHSEGHAAASGEGAHPPLHIGTAPEHQPVHESLAVEPVAAALAALHPLDRPDRQERSSRSETAEANRIRLAWAKLLWLLSFLAVLLAISYLVPYIAEQTQYAITRGRQRAEHDYAREHLEGSPLGQLSRAYQMVSQAVGPSVVHISTQGSGGTDMYTRPAFGSFPRTPSDGQGSGCIVDASGYILTNYHVVRDAREIKVSLADGRRVPAQMVGFDPLTDLAVVKVEADKLTAAEWGDSDDAQVGALVWAVGSPFGLERTITSGILSAKHRAGLAGTPYQDFLQSDAAVNPGNSGGPLVNSDGRVIGINTAIVGDAYQGVSFAIPSSVAREVFQRIRSEGLVRRGWLGVRLDLVDDTRAQEIGLPQKTGVYIVEVVEQEQGGSPAAKAGILPGDVILRWNDEEVASPELLSTLVAKANIGSRAKIVLFRDGREVEVEATIGQRMID
ncbi:MAG TPA: trypsin-like peptidase domain-containing protein [Pirellulaceae bacterium]|nr:trypsin-like peptidase domain-containing protein [Pirellulaceae bacterium]